MAEGEPHSPEALRGEGTWTAEHLRYYLLAMAFNKWEQDFCLAQRDFPRQIHLSTAWHETFGAMRQETARDGYERWGLIGVTTDRSKVVLSQPQVFVCGGRDVIEAEDKLHAMMHAAQKGIPYVVGTFHSHPSFGKLAFRAFNLT